MDLKLPACTLVLLCCVSCGMFGHGKKSAPAPAATATGKQVDRQQIVKATGHADIVMMQVPASRGMAQDSVVKALSMPFGEASLPRSIGEQLKQIQKQGKPAYVGGPSPSKTEWALREALIHEIPGSLPGLIIYTDAPLTNDLKNASRRAGASVLAVKP